LTKIKDSFIILKIMKNLRKIIVKGIILVVVFGLFLPQNSTYAATYYFTQNDWSGGATTTQAVHPTNQTGWNYYSSSTDLITGPDIKLPLKTNSVTQTSDTDFNLGNFSNTTLNGSGNAANVSLMIKGLSGIAAGSNYSLALKRDGTLWAWGYNGSGQLGLGDYNSRATPTQVGTSTDWIAIAAGYSHSLALKRDGTLWAWGYNGLGQLGLGDYTSRNIPTQVGTSTDWIAIAAGASHSLAIKRDGTLWAWGYNGYGQLGLGDTTNRLTPTQVGTSTDWIAIAAGDLSRSCPQKRWHFMGLGI
jgi:hypothetical protein